MGIINRLPSEISNKIAAGEVVERPASAVKELVENAIDAGATAINVEISRGGTTYIRVTDNGSGMAREDAEVAFFRHATSKISTQEDLDAIYTLGFRGEALSSIGAVSEAELLTKRSDAPVGTRVTCIGGQISDAEDAGIPDGTTFVVRNLFFNTPARMNFLKKDATEGAAVTDIMERFILSHPEISFRYICDGKEKYFTSGNGDLVGCIYAVYGKNYAKSIIPISYETELLKITGAIGKGDAARPNRGYQSFFVNKRYIKSLRISSAVENAYKNQIMIGKHPMAILNIEINPRHTDINVHPTKLEVKFSREDEVMRAIYHAVQNALYAIPNVPQIEHKPLPSVFSRDAVTIENQAELSENIKEDTLAGKCADKKSATTEKNAEFAPKTVASTDNEREKTILPLDAAVKTRDVRAAEKVQYGLDATNSFFSKKREQLAEDGVRNTFVPLDSAAEPRDSTKIDRLARVEMPRESAQEEKPIVTPQEHTGTTDEDFYAAWGFRKDSVRVIGQIFDTYIIAQSGDTMIIADQHAAHERLKYEELKRELAKREVTSQMLLVPVTVELTPGEHAAYLENAEGLSNLGFEIEEFGASTLLVRATPEALDADELQNLVIELIDKLSAGDQPISEKNERALYTIACKAAVKANHRYSVKELETLLGAVFELEGINTCPHGRPIIVTMTKKELEKEFKRIV